MFVRCSNSSSDILAAAHQKQHSCETLICQCHQTMLRLLSSVATASTVWQVCELYCLTTYIESFPLGIVNQYLLVCWRQFHY